nr:F-box domain containing protein [Pandoravirus aubagnensis]
MEPQYVAATQPRHQPLHMDDLPVEILHHVLNGTDQDDRPLFDPYWRFAAALVCRRWKAVVRDPAPSRSRAFAAITKGPRRSLDSALEKEDAFLVDYSRRARLGPPPPDTESDASRRGALWPDRESFKRAAAEGRLVSAAHLVDNVKTGSRIMSETALVLFDPVPWSGVTVPAPDAALCRLLALDDGVASSVRIAAIDGVLYLLAHRDRNRAACALLSRLVRHDRAILIDALIDHVPSAFNPWWHIRLACKHDRPASLAGLLCRALASERKPKKWIAMAWRKVALYDSVGVFKVMLDNACPSWATASLKDAWPMLRALCAESWVADGSWQRKAARNGSWRVLDACAARGWPIYLDQVIREAALYAWWHTVAWAIQHASAGHKKSAGPCGDQRAEETDNANDVDTICEDALRALMRAAYAWSRNTHAQAQRNTVDVLCAHLERRLGRDRWPGVAAAIWRDSPHAASDDAMPWSRPFVFARWHSVLPVAPHEIRSIIISTLAVNDYCILDTLVAALATMTSNTGAMATENAHDTIYVYNDNGAVESAAEIVCKVPAPKSDTIDLWQEAVERYIQATRTMQRHRRRYGTRHQDMDTFLASWNQSDAAEMLMFLASVTATPTVSVTRAPGRDLWPSISASDHVEGHVNGRIDDRDDSDNNSVQNGKDKGDQGRRAGPVTAEHGDTDERETNNHIPGLYATTEQWERVCCVVPIASDQVGWAPASNIASHLASWLAERGLLLDAPTTTS